MSPVEQRSLNILQDGQRGNEVVALKDEPNVVGPNVRQTLVIQGSDILAGQLVDSRGGPVQTPQQIEESALPRAGRPHDGDVVPFRDQHLDALQHLQRLATYIVGLAQILNANRNLLRDGAIRFWGLDLAHAVMGYLAASFLTFFSGLSARDATLAGAGSST